MTTKSWKATEADLNARIKSWLGSPYRSLVRRSWEMSTDEFWNYQAQAFERLYAFARRRVPFYIEHLDIYPALPTQKDVGLEFLTRLPILRKQTVKKHNSELWASPLPALTRFHTKSGTTGTPLQLQTTLQEIGLAYPPYEE